MGKTKRPQKTKDFLKENGVYALAIGNDNLELVLYQGLEQNKGLVDYGWTRRFLAPLTLGDIVGGVIVYRVGNFELRDGPKDRLDYLDTIDHVDRKVEGIVIPKLTVPRLSGRSKEGSSCGKYFHTDTYIASFPGTPNNPLAISKEEGEGLQKLLSDAHIIG